MRKLILIFSLSLLVINGDIFAQQDSIWTLEKCIDYALKQNIDVRQSELSNKKSGLYAGQAKAQRFPSVNASVNQNFNWSRSTAGYSGFSGANGSGYSITSGVILYNASKLSNQIKQAQLEIESGEYSLETTKESISLNILNAFLDVLYAGEQVENSQKQIESTAGQLALAQERLALKAISLSDFSQVKAQLASEKLTLANAESQLSMAKITLMQLMELPVSENFNIAHPDLQGSLNQKRVPDVYEIYERALAIKPQIKNASVNKEIAGLDEKIAKASYFPVLSASAGLSSSFSSEKVNPYFDQLNDGINTVAGFSLSIPIYQKKEAKTSVAIARIGYQDAELSEINTKNQLRKNIEQACLDVTSAQIKYEASVENYLATTESTALSDEKFRQGIINSVDFLVSKTNLIVAESELLQSKYNLIFSYKVLDFYSGIPLSL
ncbi:MAG: TolC family protein [Bacteroidales bacterium]|nr:TolC family protein [Bacteroidales bacterium]